MSSHFAVKKLRRRGVVVSLVVMALVSGCGEVSLGGGGSMSSMTLDPGGEATVMVSMHCGYETLEIDINGSAWTTDGLGQDAAGNPTEPAWPAPGSEVEMELELVDAETLNATVPGTSVTHVYSPDPSPPGCD